MFNILDIVIIGVILLSAVLAAWRGFTREVLSIGAWVGAAIVMFLLGPRAVPLAAQYIHSDKPGGHGIDMPTIAAYGAVFLITLIPLAYISYRISEGVRDSFVGPVDRLLGFVFGGARGLLIVGIGYLVFTSLVSEARQPDWFREARLKPLMAGTGNLIAKLLPSRDGGTTATDKDDDAEIGGPEKPASTPPASKPVANPPAQPAPAPPPPSVPATPAVPSKPKPTAPKAQATPPGPATPADKSAGGKPERSAGYGEQQRDALDQLIGSATASPGGDKPSKADGHGAHR